MGNYRSRSGCLTCRARRVKCDETRPVCNACSKKNRPCQWEAPYTKFKGYQPDASSGTPEASSVTPDAGGENDHSETENTGMDIDTVDMVDESEEGQIRPTSQARAERRTSQLEVPSQSTQPSPASPFLVSESRSPSDGVYIGSSRQLQVPERQSRPFSHEPVPLTHEEASLVHHYTEHLGRWLDCTDAARQFTLGIPEKVKLCPVLLNAVQSFAARHCGDHATAEASYQRCIALLIERLNEDTASHDETLLCAIVILRFYEQLNVPSSTGSDDEQHLAGCSAIIRTSQGHHYVDPSAPSLREAAFWVYVRQCLYNATINQQTPDIDFSLQLHPSPGSMHDSHPLAHLRLETAWANQMTWNTACVVNFCFETSEPVSERAYRNRRWKELWALVEAWASDRPAGFNPIYEGQANEKAVFPEIWFTADWHVVSYGFYHFSCILLLSYKPGPKFAIRNTESLSATDILEHARAICGACRSSPETVPLSITLCHTVFIWGPLLSNPRERDEVLDILVDFENTHRWPTTWITNALKREWGMR